MAVCEGRYYDCKRRERHPGVPPAAARTRARWRRADQPVQRRNAAQSRCIHRRAVIFPAGSRYSAAQCCDVVRPLTAVRPPADGPDLDDRPTLRRGLRVSGSTPPWRAPSAASPAGSGRVDTARTAWALTLGLAAFLLLSLAATVALNRWNRWFFDALERKDAETAALAVLVFAGIIAAMAAVGVGIVLTRETLQVRWRAWIVDRLLGTWLARDRYYHLGVTHTEPANPEYRIADDTRWATEPLVDLAIGLFSALDRRRRLHQHPVVRRRIAQRRRSAARRSPFPPTWSSWRWPTAASCRA